MKCKKCGDKMIKKINSKNNEPFLGCSNFPKCKYTTLYVDTKENTELIKSIINKYEKDIRNKLNIPNKVKVIHNFLYDMEFLACCTRIEKFYYKIDWNIEVKRNTLCKIVMDLAHEYRHVYQQHFNLFNNVYDTDIPWIQRPEEQDANKFMYEYIDLIIQNYNI